MKQTPGSWVAIRGHDENRADRWTVCTESEPHYLIAVIENGAPGDTLETEGCNAHLIAAAPELLAAALIATAEMECYCCDVGVAVQEHCGKCHLVAAIAKAEGRK